MILDLAILASEIPASSGVSTSQLVLGVLGASSVAAVLGATVAGLFQRRKLGADATEIITRAASGVVELLKAENVDLLKRLAERDQQIESMRRIVEDHTAVLQLHVAWDAIVVAELAKRGVANLPPPPPVYHPAGSPGRVRATLDGQDSTTQ